MSTLEIPPEVNSVLNTKDPTGHIVMRFIKDANTSRIFILGEKCTEEELRELGVSDDQLHNSNPIKCIDFKDTRGRWELENKLHTLRFVPGPFQSTVGPWLHMTQYVRLPQPTFSNYVPRGPLLRQLAGLPPLTLNDYVPAQTLDD